MIILLALLNDLPIMTIVTDNTVLEKNPVRWKMRRILTISTILGCIGVTSTFLLLFIIKSYFQLSSEEIQSFIFLKLSLAGHQTLFVARTKQAFYSKPYPSAILLGTILTTQTIAALIVGFGFLIAPVPWSYIGYLWVYTLVWMFIADKAKQLSYSRFNFKNLDL